MLLQNHTQYSQTVLFSHGPDMLLKSPTQILTQFVSLWTGHATAESHQNYYTISIWAKYVTGHSHPNSYIMYLDAPASSSMVDHTAFDIR